MDKPFIQLIRSAVWGCCCEFNRCICDRLQTLKHVNQGKLRKSHWTSQYWLPAPQQLVHLFNSEGADSSQPTSGETEPHWSPGSSVSRAFIHCEHCRICPANKTSPKEPIWNGNRVIIELNTSENVLRELGAATSSQKYGNRLNSLKLTDFRKGSFHQEVRSGQARSATLLNVCENNLEHLTVGRVTCLNYLHLAIFAGSDRRGRSRRFLDGDRHRALAITEENKSLLGWVSGYRRNNTSQFMQRLSLLCTSLLNILFHNITWPSICNKLRAFPLFGECSGSLTSQHCSY